MEKYITDNGFGAKKSDASQGYSDETIKKNDDSFEIWSEERQKEEGYRNTGFAGRATGEER